MSTSSQEFDEKTTAQLLEGISIPPQPKVLCLVMEEKQRDNPDLRKIADAVAKDVAFSAAMLRAANSPAFGLRQKVTAIPQAVMLLGMNNVVSLITGLSLRLAMSGNKKINLDNFWDSAADTAVICSILARRFKIMDPDQAYMLGLFHDCGIPLLMQKFSNYLEIFKHANVDITQPVIIIEDRELKTNHAIIGCLVARSWFFPEEIRLVIRHHHDEDILINRTNVSLAGHIGLLILAEYISNRYHRIGIDDVVWQRMANTVMEIFSLTTDCVEDLCEDMDEILSNL